MSEARTWKLLMPRSGPHKKREGFDKAYYFDTPEQLAETIARSHIKVGTIRRYRIIDDSSYTWDLISTVEGFNGWLLTQPGKVEYWSGFLDQLRFSEDEVEALRWRIRFKDGPKWHHTYTQDAITAIRLVVTHPNRELHVQHWKKRKGHGIFYPESGNCIEWLSSGDPKLGKTAEEWRQLIEKIRANASEEKMMRRVALEPRTDRFGLNELLTLHSGRIYEVEISDALKDALDDLNRPYAKDPTRLRVNRIWPANAHISKRLWPHNIRTSPHTGKVVDLGNWISIEQAVEILERTSISPEEFEGNMMGIKSSNAARVLRGPFPKMRSIDLAALCGFYYSGGSHIHREREHSTEDLYKIIIGEEVLPTLEETAGRLGFDVVERNPLKRAISEAVKMNTARSKRRLSLSLLNPFMEVMRHHGVVLPSVEGRNVGAKKAMRDFNPVIPDWIRENPEYMDAMIEAYINGPHSSADMKTIGGHIMLRIHLTFYGSDEALTMKFVKVVLERLKEAGIGGSPGRIHQDRSRFGFRYVIHNENSLSSLVDHYEIVKGNLRSRLILKLSGDPIVSLILRDVTPAQAMIIGHIYESPKTQEELQCRMMLNPEALRRSLIGISNRGVIELRDNRYEFDTRIFESRMTKKTHREYEKLVNKIQRYSRHLLHQCEECRRVYLKPRSDCSCGGRVKPVERVGVIRPLNRQMNGTRRRKFLLEKINLKMRENQ